MTKMYIQLSMDNELFEWDNEKNTINRQKHGIGFEEALLVFDDLLHIELYDAAHSDKEDRFLAIGTVLNVLIVLVVYTERNQKVRIISARPATNKEKELYYDAVNDTFGS
ncbi:BrnT family toxin [Treponema sp. OMZ 906]|nr:BrnT family toxin [Treponema sp. OMZ 906]